jgi:hypothetical protein
VYADESNDKLLGKRKKNKLERRFRTEYLKAIFENGEL